MSDIPASARWSIDTVWQIEKQWIGDFITAQADGSWRRCKGNIDEAKARAPGVWQKIREVFPENNDVDTDLRDAAERGRLEREAGSRLCVIGLRVVLAILIFAEMAVFTFVWAVGQAYAIIVVQGAILGAGAWLLGWGLQRYSALKNPATHPLRMVLSVIAMAIGITFIASMTTLLVRFAGEVSSRIIAISLPVALWIAVLENIRGWASLRYIRQHERMFRAQEQFANQHHRALHQAKGEKWIEQFLLAIDAQAKKEREP